MLQILVADDDLPRRQALCTTLEQSGLVPSGLGSGEEVLAAFEPGRYHLILLDAKLPGMDPYDTAAAIRNREANSTESFFPVHLAVCFPQLSMEVRRQAFAFDINHCLRQPVRPAALRQTLKHVVRFRDRLEVMHRNVGPSLDGEMLNALVADGEQREPGTFVALIDLFLTNIPPLLRHFNDAIQQADPRSIRLISRRLQGSCLSVGAHGIIHLCEEILGAVRRQHSPEGFRFLLNEEFTRVVSRLHHLREQEVAALGLEQPTH